MQTSALALDLIRTAEGFSPDAYICPAGQVTIGYGNTCWEDGEPVHLGDEIDEAGATQLLWSFVRNEVEPALDRLVKVPLQPCQRDAFASFVFNFGEAKARAYTLTRLINEQAPTAEICDWWVKYRMGGGKPLLGLYRRRLAEVLMWNGLPTEKAWTATEKTTWRELCGVPAYEPIKAEPVLILDKPLPMEAKVERPIEELDPTPETPLTTEDLNYIQYVRVGGKKPFSEFSLSPAKLQAVKPNYKPELPEKVGTVDMKVTTRFKGEHNRQSGIDMQKVGGGAAITATTLGSISQAMGAANKTTTETQTLMTTLPVTYIVFGLLGFAALYFGIGWFRRWYGANQRYKGEVKASQYMH